MNTPTHCLCGSGLDYKECCGSYHRGAKIPSTAEQLMRSRYTAYAMRDGAYLQATWDAAKRPKDIDFSRETIEWVRLEITEIKKGGLKDDKGIVAFKAFYLDNGDEHMINEISRFIKTDGRWFYLDGVIKSIGKIGGTQNEGKNAPCPCGSGKKFKRCCGA